MILLLSCDDTLYPSHPMIRCIQIILLSKENPDRFSSNDTISVIFCPKKGQHAGVPQLGQWVRGHDTGRARAHAAGHGASLTSNLLYPDSITSNDNPDIIILQ